MNGPGFHQELRQKQTQQLVLAPQLRQSLKILQVAALDLRSAIQEELESNPALEELPMEMLSLDRENESEEGSSGSGDEREEMDFTREFDILRKLDQDWRDHFAQAGGSQPHTQEDAERRQHFFDSLVGEVSLQQHLLQQAELADVSPDVMAALRYLIGSLDDRGFLTSSIADLALYADLPLEAMQEAARLVRTFDPPGIGAADLGECLLIQLELQGRGESLSARVIRDHFDLLARRRIPELARKLGVRVDDIQEAIAEIGRLDPSPGRRFAADSNTVVIPDVTVEKDGDEWAIHLNNDYIPRLRLNPEFKDLLAKPDLTSEDREYLAEKIRSGKFVMSAIEQRQNTIERITREIIKAQRDFFEEGVSKLHPLTMTRIAEAVGVHETTVSRAIANKYIKTPHGIFELKYFFTPGYRSDDGQAISNTSVKDMIAGLIDGEDKAKPLSDQEIVHELSSRGIKIARRTVAKYREELGILPSNLRREYGGG